MLEILTPCPDSGDFPECARRCDHTGDEPVWIEGRGIDLAGWFHVEELLTPQERTARAHAQQQRQEKVDEYIREALDRAYAQIRDMRWSVDTQIFGYDPAVDVEPSDPGTTIPPELNP